MASIFPNGAVFSLGTTYGSAKVVSAVTNANPGVASSTAHGFTDGDIVLIQTASRLNGRVIRVDNSATNAFDLEGVDTSSTTTYPSGFGVGTATEVTAWTALSQTVDVQSSGGEQQFYQWTYLEDGRQQQRPTFKNARTLTLTMDYDPSLAWHAALLAADEEKTLKALRVVLPDGSTLYYSGYVGFDGEPAVRINENMKVTASFALAAINTRYSA